MIASCFLLSLASAAAVVVAAPYGTDQGIVSRDSNPGCTSNSTKDFAWSVSYLTYNASYIFTPSHEIASGSGTVRFTVRNPALAYDITCQASSSQLDDFFYGTQTYTCAQASGGQQTFTTFTYDYPGRVLGLNQTWHCSDEDPQFPYTYFYGGTANLTLGCTEHEIQKPISGHVKPYARIINCTSNDFTLLPSTVSAIG